jgi:hypothetical protein
MAGPSLHNSSLIIICMFFNRGVRIREPWAGVRSGLDGVECWVSMMAFRGAVSRHDSPSMQILITIISCLLILN